MNWIKKILNGDEKENLIYLLEQIYNDLKTRNPDKDEHWLLINTYMARYGNWEASKQKGQELMKYISFKDTFQYSLLDFPKSIRGLTLFLSYKERGNKEIEDEVEESAQIVGLIQKIYEEKKLLEEYQKRNPLTWSEVHNEKDESVYGLYGFLKSSDYLNKHPEEMEKVMREMEE
jgi:hypothetical protein